MENLYLVGFQALDGPPSLRRSDSMGPHSPRGRSAAAEPVNKVTIATTTIMMYHPDHDFNVVIVTSLSSVILSTSFIFIGVVILFCTLTRPHQVINPQVQHKQHTLPLPAGVSFYHTRLHRHALHACPSPSTRDTTMTKHNFIL